MRFVALLTTLAAVAVAVFPGAASAGATCSDYDNQRDAQRAADTRDADGDGIYCESLPCPCLKPGEDEGSDDDAKEPSSRCVRPRRTVSVVFTRRKYRAIYRHFRVAVRKGWPRRLVLNRPGADARRDRLLSNYPTRKGRDRDEYPPAVGRGRGKGLQRGRNPRGWKASVRYVPPRQNRSHGAVLGNELARYCNGTRFRYVFRRSSRPTRP